MGEGLASIYKITNSITGLSYIGVTSNLEKRISDHLSGTGNRIIRECISDGFVVAVLYQSYDYNHCKSIIEPLLIKEHNTLWPNGYNLAKGGEGGSSLGKRWVTNGIDDMYILPNADVPVGYVLGRKYRSHPTRNPIGELNPRFGYKFTDTERNEHSETMVHFYSDNPDKLPIGERNGMYGKSHTTEWKEKHSSTLRDKYKRGEVKKIQSVSCVYCQTFLTPGNLSRHERVCTLNPFRVPKSKGVTHINCEYCGLLVSRYKYRRYHGDLCKFAK